MRYVQRTRQLGAPDLVILPGTKNTMDDLRWLRESGLEAAVLRLSAAGTPVLGVCGGYQMLGEQLCDPAGEESGTPCTLRGLGLLPTTTVFGTEKHLTQTAACVTTDPFAGAKLTGYEIPAGRTEVRGSAFCILADGTPEGCVQDGVFGTYLHGLFDTGELTEKLTAFLCKRKGIDPAGAELIPMEQYRQQQFDLLFHLLDGRLQFGDLAASHFAHLLVLVVGEDVLGFGQVGQRRAVAFRGFDDRLQLLVLLVELHELFDVGDDFGVGEFLPRLLVFEFQAVETAQNAVVCHKSLILPAKIRNNRQTAMRRLKKRGCASPWGDYCPAGQSDSRRERTCWPNSCTAACTTASASSLPALLRLVAGRIPTSTQPGRPGCRRSTEAGFYASFSFFSQSSVACCHCSLYSKWSRMPQPCPPVG